MSEPKVLIELTPQAAERVRWIQARLGETNVPNTTRQCYRLMEWLLRQIDDGWELQLVKDDQAKSVELITKEKP